MEANAPLLLLAKATLLLGLAFIAIGWERTSPAARRHGMWSATFAALLALPVLALILPAFSVPVPAWNTSIATHQQPAQVVGSVASDVRRPEASPGTSQESRNTAPDSRLESPLASGLRLSSVSPVRLLIALWLLGVAAAFIALLRSLLRVRRLASSGHHVDDRDWHESAARIARRLGLDEAPELVVSSDVSAPMAGNIVRPTVFLPSDAPTWDTDRRDIVLTHEITHLVRRDPLRILAARVACALYWFHPLMWIAARRSTADCEQACDESVLALGIRPSTYARVLLDFAHNAPAPVLSVALPIVHRHRLEARVMAILSNTSTHRSRAISPRRTFLTAIAAVAMIGMVAAARPAAIGAEPIVTAVAAVTVTGSPEKSAATPVVSTPAMVPDAVPPAVQSPLVMQDVSCWTASARSRSFSGSSQVEGSRVIQRVGRVGRERVAQMTFGDLRVCMMTDGFDGSDVDEPSDWVGRADRIVLETDRDNDVRRLEIDRGRNTYTINGRAASTDDGVTAWRRAALDLLDASWEISDIRGQESSLRGEISSVHGERSSLLGEISSLRGEVSSMQGEISSLRGEESSLRGEISSIRGHESSLRGEISSLRGEISSLEGSRSDRYSDRAAIDARINRIRDAIRGVEEEIDRYDADGRVRAVERRISTFDVDRKVAEVQDRIRAFDVERRVAAVERELSGLNVERHVRRIEDEIGGLNVDTRVRELSGRRDTALDRLRSILGVR